MQAQLLLIDNSILWAAVRHYIATRQGQWVQKLWWGVRKPPVSARTIRNAMGVLKSWATPTKPHLPDGAHSDSWLPVSMITPSDIPTPR